ncbi:regulator [Vibrio coralliilyticus]|uniref:regulator n=1 Tax=Vibrio coralliilyticus TaxID=190893 RepID=UPI001E53EDDB|nr:regulator [Vibrio coralliilyticus]MCC2524322.1 regulator [Vibrio coralliilyticus]
MKYYEMTKNYIFREFECGLSVKETAELCFKNIKTVKKWDKGAEIPNECKRLMRQFRKKELSHCKEWHCFKMKRNMLELPTQLVTPQQVLTGIGLLEINSELEVMTSTKLLKLARSISDIKTR